MSKFKCPGNEVDGPCGAIVEGKRRDHPDSEIVALERHLRKGTLIDCRRRWVFHDECVTIPPYTLMMSIDEQTLNATKLYPEHDIHSALYNYRCGEERIGKDGRHVDA